MFPGFPPSPSVPLWAALPCIGLGALALRADVRAGRIPDRLTLPAVVIGWATHAVVAGPAGLGDSLLGLVTAGALLLPGGLMGWTGGGDMKLVAAAGAWLGYPFGSIAVVVSLIVSGIMAGAVALRRRIVER